MANTVYDRYMEAEVLSADPLRLVCLLYRGAIDASRAARACLKAGDIRGRSRQINRAWAILRELAGSLDPGHESEISRRLAGLYAYMQTLLLEANVKQSPAPLVEVEALLSTLLEGWTATGKPHPALAHAGQVDSDAENNLAALTWG